MNGRRGILVALTLLAALGCGREQEQAETSRTPIVESRLRTPRRMTRVGEALSAHTPKPGEADEPIVHDAVGELKKPVAEPKQAKTEPSPLPPQPSPTTAIEKPSSAAPEPTPIRVARRAVVARGVELRDAPGGQVLGDFGGRTDVEVLEERAGWSRVKTPVVDGGSIEGWVESARLDEVAAKPIAVAKPAAKTAASTAKPAASTAKTEASSPAKAAPKAAKKAGDKGPDKVNLVPIAGTEKKRPATPFTHKAHYDDYSVKCESCHHPVKAKGGDVGSYVCSTSGCHTANECNSQTVGKKNKACPNFEDAYHLNCIECHKKDGGPTKCAECHTG